MDLTGQERIAAPRVQVWQALNGHALASGMCTSLLLIVGFVSALSACGTNTDSVLSSWRLLRS